MIHSLFYPYWNIKHNVFPDLLNLSVWREDLPVFDNLTQSPRKGIKFLRFCQIQKVKISRLNIRLKHKLSTENAKRAIHLQLGGTILLILIFILNSYSFIWKTLTFPKFLLKSVWWYYIKIYGSQTDEWEVFSLAHMGIILHYVKSPRCSSICTRF